MRDPEPDPDLVQAAARGDAAALRSLMEAWGPVVLRWTTWLGRPGVEPEDAAHDAIVAALTGLPGLRDPQAFPAWLFRVVKRETARNGRQLWLRRRAPDPPREPSSPGPDPSQEAERLEARTQLWAVLAALPRRHREVLVLCVIEDRTCAEAARLLDIPQGTAKRRLQAARIRLRRAWARRGAAGSPAIREEDP